jgi:general secretion pathway protein C
VSALALPRLVESRWPPLALALLAVAWIAALLVELLWSLLTPVEELPVAPVQTRGEVVREDTVALAQFHLFGSSVDPAAAYANAPDTELKLVLRGTSSHNDPIRARALIADEGGDERVYKVGDVVPGNVRVQHIYPDRVVLNTNGRIEVLRLRTPGVAGLARAPTGTAGGNAAPPTPAFGFAPPAAGASAPGSGGVNPMVVSAPIDWEAVRQQAIADPSAIARQFSVLPVMIDGKLAGVRVSSNVHGNLLVQAGLKPEDIVTAVNGRRLTSIESGYEALESLKSAGAVTLTVDRDGSEVTLPAIRMPR